MYVTNCIEPNIEYVVGLLCMFTSRPSNEHWKSIERVMRILEMFDVIFERLF